MRKALFCAVVVLVVSLSATCAAAPVRKPELLPMDPITMVTTPLGFSARVLGQQMPGGAFGAAMRGLGWSVAVFTFGRYVYTVSAWALEENRYVALEEPAIARSMVPTLQYKSNQIRYSPFFLMP